MCEKCGKEAGVSQVKFTQTELLEIIKEEILKELVGYDTQPIAVPAQTADDLAATHQHMVMALQMMEKAKQEAVSDDLKGQIQQLQDDLLAGASGVMESLTDLVGMESRLTENSLKEGATGSQRSPREDTNYPDFELGEEIVPAYVEESKRNSAIQGLLQAHIALQKVKGQEDATQLVEEALTKLGYDSRTETLKYYQGVRAGYSQGTYTE